ncbi:DUF4349 domain-containing protein [Pseudalkalibacillus hwajinpoensis]|uniref:DUF4349 domain-containing protein n=1 Tax=Guptibacillus hwajinpoensis TaxID=208199 RepID=UPI001CFCD726|nr:DUF4349 domain-containing protein [Pseudalkalibacillus hwajinpoensis]
MKRWLLLIFTSILILVGCNSNEGRNSLESSDRNTSTVHTEQNKDSDSSGGNSSSAEVQPEVPALQQERKVIFNADLFLTVESVAKKTEKIKELTSTYGGYVVEERLTSENNALFGSIAVRIPQPQFNGYLHEIETLGEGTPQKSIIGTDMTENYVDLTSRLQAKEAVQQRLEAFLIEATNTDDLLAISNELSRVQEEIEQLKGQINYLDNQSDFSTVTISMEQQKLVSGIGDEDFHLVLESKKLFMRTLNGLLAFFSRTIVVLIGLSPILAPLLVMSLFILNRFRKKAKQKAGQ